MQRRQRRRRRCKSPPQQQPPLPLLSADTACASAPHCTPCAFGLEPKAKDMCALHVCACAQHQDVRKGRGTTTSVMNIAVAPQPVLQATPRTTYAASCCTSTSTTARAAGSRSYHSRPPRQRLGAASNSKADLDWLRALLPAADRGETLRLCSRATSASRRFTPASNRPCRTKHNFLASTRSNSTQSPVSKLALLYVVQLHEPMTVPLSLWRTFAWAMPKPPTARPTWRYSPDKLPPSRSFTFAPSAYSCFALCS